MSFLCVFLMDHKKTKFDKNLEERKVPFQCQIHTILISYKHFIVVSTRLQLLTFHFVLWLIMTIFDTFFECCILKEFLFSRFFLFSFLCCFKPITKKYRSQIIINVSQSSITTWGQKEGVFHTGWIINQTLISLNHLSWNIIYTFLVFPVRLLSFLLL